jgi:hypothetical protein
MINNFLDTQKLNRKLNIKILCQNVNDRLLHRYIPWNGSLTLNNTAFSRIKNKKII